MKSSTCLEASPATGAKIPCLWEGRRQDVKDCGVIFDILPCVVHYKSGNRCIYGNDCLYRHADGEEKPSKKSKKESTQGAVAILRQQRVQGCASHKSDPKKSFLRKAGQTRLNASARTHHKILRTHVVRNSNSGKKRAISRQEECARKASWDLSRKNVLSSRPRTKLRFILLWKKDTGASLQKHRRAYVCGWFGSFSAHAEQEGFKLSRNGYFAEIQNPYDGGDRKWRSANKRGSTSFRSWSRSVRHSAITRRNASRFYRLVSFAQNTDIRMSGKNGETPRLTQNGKTITCTMDYFVLRVVPGLSPSSSSSSASTSIPKDQSNSSGESEASSDPVRTRSDKPACGKSMQTDRDKLASENRGPAHKKRDEQGVQRKAFSIGYSPSQMIWRTKRRMCPQITLKERSQIRKVMLQKWGDKKRKHMIYTHFLKDRNCDICLKTKITDEGSIPPAEKFGDLITAESQSPQRRKWIPEKSPIRCRGTRSRHSRDTVLSV